jgi:hypothetical protein
VFQIIVIGKARFFSAHCDAETEARWKEFVCYRYIRHCRALFRSERTQQFDSKENSKGAIRQNERIAEEKQLIKIEGQVKIGRDVEHRVRDGQYDNDQPCSAACFLFPIDCLQGFSPIVTVRRASL